MKNICIKYFLVFSLITVLTFITVGCSSKKDAYEEKSYAISAVEINTLTIDVSDRYIDISKSMDDQIHILYYENKKEFYNIDLSQDKELKMVCSYNKDWSDYIGFIAPKKDRTIQIQIPDSSIENLNLITSNEDVLISPLSLLGEINIKNDNGNIALEKVSVGSGARLEAEYGNISGTIVGAYDDFSIISKAKSGNNNLPSEKKSGNKTLNVYTDDGDISLEINE